MNLTFSDTEKQGLIRKEPRFEPLIAQLKEVSRSVDADLFSVIIHQMIAQQISDSQQSRIWMDLAGPSRKITPERLLDLGSESLRQFGISRRKAGWILELAKKVADNELDLNSLESLPDSQVQQILTQEKGIGLWTAKMILLFGLKRKDILSFSDYGIRKGLCLLYEKSELDQDFFEAIRNRISPYGSLASILLWELAAGRISVSGSFSFDKSHMACFQTPAGTVRAVSDGRVLISLTFVDDDSFDEGREDLDPVLLETRDWLQEYFSGANPENTPLLELQGTDFQEQVWKILLSIPYGSTVSYQSVARMIAAKRGMKAMSSQAIGQAVSKNPIVLMIPCHRVIASDGSIGGYAYGISRKKLLLELEQKEKTPEN